MALTCAYRLFFRRTEGLLARLARAAVQVLSPNQPLRCAYPRAELTGLCLPAADSAYVDMDEIGLRIIADASATELKRRLVDECKGAVWDARVYRLAFNV
jgi:hypothetical protein